MRLPHIFHTRTIVNLILYVSLISASSNALVIIRFDSDSAFNDASAKYSSKGFTFYSDNRTMEIFSVPIQFTLNPTKFVPVTATLIADNATAYASDLNNIVYARSVLPGDVFFSFESWAAWRYRSFRPSALIACGGSYAVGGLQALFDLLQTSGGFLNITITDSPENPFLDRRTGGLFIFYSALLCSWAACIFVMSILTLFRRGVGRNLGTICLSLDLLGSCVRFAFALDPWADRFMPPQVIDILFTSSWTIVISGTILLLSFWHELTTQVSMNITSVLDKNTIPTIVTISFLFVIEIISDILRCIRFNGDIVQGIVVVIYLIVAIVVSCFFIYVFVRVTKFLSDKGLGGRKESVLRTFSIRAIFCVAGFVLVTIAGAVYAGGINYYESGEGALNFVIHVCINMVSTAQVIALLASSPSRGGSKTESSTSKTQNDS